MYLVLLVDATCSVTDVTETNGFLFNIFYYLFINGIYAGLTLEPLEVHKNVSPLN